MVHEPDPHLNTSRYRYELWIHDGWPIHVDVGIPTRRQSLTRTRHQWTCWPLAFRYFLPLHGA